MSTKVLEASPESGNRIDPFSSNNANIYVQGTLKNARIGGTSCGLSVVMESASATEHVGSLAAQTLASHPVVAGVGVGGAAGSGRKRHQSTSKSAGQIKRRRKTYERNGSKPKFLLGGSITDPLNLNSLDDEEISKIANAVTPACSPLPHINKDPDPVIVPQDFKDPLKLNITDDNPENNSPLTKTLVPRKSSGKKKKYHSSGEAKRDSIESLGNSDRDGESSCARPLWLELQNNKTTKLANKIVSPVLPDSRGRKRKASRTEPSSRLAKALLIDDLLPLPKPKAKSTEPESKRSRKSPDIVNKLRRQHSHDAKSSRHLPKFKEQDKKFQYGNYARYYGYRTPNSDDSRIDFFKREWFKGKKCLDIGCNSGHVTLAIAKLFDPSKIVGVDIDGNLIGAARKNVKQCLEEQYREKKGKGRVDFPVSLQKTYGPLAPAASTSSPVGRKTPGTSLFPANILFRCANFVLEKDSLLETQREEYDTILCLSVTKWIHLNWGDAGIKRFFKRIFRALHPGGRLILEPQAWPSYQKKRKMTEKTYQNYNEIRFQPHQFKDYLLSQEIGFASCEVIGTPINKSKGFRRPMMMFTKLQISSRPVSRRPSTEKPPATVTSSIHVTTPQPLMQPAASSSTTATPCIGDEARSTVKEEPPAETVPTPTPQPLMKPEVSSSAAETSGIGKKVRSKVKEEPLAKTIPMATAQPLMKPEVSSSAAETSGIEKKGRSNVKEEPSVETIPTAAAQPLMKPEVSSSAVETSGIGKKVRSKVKEEPSVETIPRAASQSLMKPEVSSSAAETPGIGKKVRSKVEEEPSVETISTAAPQSLMKPEVSSSAAETPGIGKKVRSRVMREPKAEPIAEKKEMEGVTVEVMDATEIPEGAEKKGVAMTIKHEDKKVTDGTASDAVAMATVKIEAEKMEEKGYIKASSSSSSSSSSTSSRKVMETKKEDEEGRRNERDSGGTT